VGKQRRHLISFRGPNDGATQSEKAGARDAKYKRTFRHLTRGTNFHVLNPEEKRYYYKPEKDVRVDVEKNTNES